MHQADLIWRKSTQNDVIAHSSNNVQGGLVSEG